MFVLDLIVDNALNVSALLMELNCFYHPTLPMLATKLVHKTVNNIKDIMVIKIAEIVHFVQLIVLLVLEVLILLVVDVLQAFSY